MVSDGMKILIFLSVCIIFWLEGKKNLERQGQPSLLPNVAPLLGVLTLLISALMEE